jgi:glutamine synthetase
VICDLVHQDGRFVEFTPRNVLKRIVALYAEDGLRPVVAPEIEFYLVRKNPDPDYPLTPPVGRSGRAIGGGAGYSIAGVNEFDELIDDIYHFSENQGLEIDTLIHEEGAGQLEINLRHGDPVELADQVFMFKRTIREAALKHDTYATFMAKPIQGQPGSAMHIHQSIVDKKTGSNIFKNDNGAETDAFFHFIGGMQKHVPNALVMFAPYVNSYRRLTQSASAPVNAKWGYDNRTTAFRVPRSDPAARRVENRIPSSDANPYLALAASLACGLIGLRNKLKPDAPVITSANEDEIDLPRGLLEAVDLFEADDELRAMLGSSFVATYAAIKRAEFETFMEVISPWEREFLLLNV